MVVAYGNHAPPSSPGIQCRLRLSATLLSDLETFCAGHFVDATTDKRDDFAWQASPHLLTPHQRARRPILAIALQSPCLAACSHLRPSFYFLRLYFF